MYEADGNQNMEINTNLVICYAAQMRRTFGICNKTILYICDSKICLIHLKLATLTV